MGSNRPHAFGLRSDQLGFFKRTYFQVFSTFSLTPLVLLSLEMGNKVLKNCVQSCFSCFKARSWQNKKCMDKLGILIRAHVLWYTPDSFLIYKKSWVKVSQQRSKRMDGWISPSQHRHLRKKGLALKCVWLLQAGTGQIPVPQSQHTQENKERRRSSVAN